jgi:DNA repair protein RecO (recombination protein O)
MPRILSTEAVCLRSVPHRETSKLVTFFTRDFGKLVLRAKGARRPKSKFGAALEVATLDRIIFYRRETRTIQTLSDAEILNDFPVLRGDGPRLTAAAVMIEFTDRSFEPEAPNPAVFQLLVGALRTLEAGTGDYAAVAYACMLKVAGRIGYAPQLSHCLSCRRARAATFSPRRGGFLCASCSTQDAAATRVTASSVRRLRRLYLGDFADNLRTPLGAEERALVTQYLQYHLDRFDLKSLRFL